MGQPEIVLALMGVAAIALVIVIHRSAQNTFDIADAFIGPDGKASLDKLILAGMAGLAGWCVVKQANAGQPVETLLLGVLGIFVLQRVASGYTNAMKPPGQP
jgi:hypothetical protein